MGTYAFVLEYNQATQDVYRVRQTLRAFRHSDNPLTMFIRTEEGPMDLSSVQSLEAMVINDQWPFPWSDYQIGAPNWIPIIQVQAYSPAPGRVMFTLTADNLRRLQGGLNTVFIRADNRTVGMAFLEVVR
jgi:hypothetical protein